MMVEIVQRALVFLAPGFEEVEALTPVDYLRRAGIEVITAALGKERLVTGSHDIPVMADTSLEDLVKEDKLHPSHWDAVILPGGMPGSANLGASGEIGVFLKDMAAEDKWVCAICAAPALVLAPLGLLEEREFTCFPGLEEKVTGAKWREDRVVVDINPSPKKGGIITSRGAGTAGDFSVAIISTLLDKVKGKEIGEKVLLRMN
jgi:4-methyl-5(b-hydroxyethyl)-thiazole monophosphate biosynthesis